MVADCPRCTATNMTFDIRAAIYRGVSYQWQRHYEICSECRRCAQPSLFKISDHNTETKNILGDVSRFVSYTGSIDTICRIEGLVGVADLIAQNPPEHLPENVASAFKEGAKCLAIGCYNASAAMFRLSIDLATKPLLPDAEDTSKPQPNHRQRRDLGLRLPWLFENGILPAALIDLASCIREDGNDGAHDGTLSKQDAEDLMDFSFELHERLFTEPERLSLAAERRSARRKP